MAETTSTQPAKIECVPLKLKGKTITLTGKYASSVEKGFGQLITSEGGTLVTEITPTLDYLVVGSSRGRTEAQKEAEHLNQKQGASIQVLNQNAFCQLFALTREEGVALIRGGEEGVARWNRLRGMCLGQNTTPIDLSGIDFRGVKFHGVNFRDVILDGADLRDAELSNVRFGKLRNVKLDGACLQSAWLSHAHDCTFHHADLSDARIATGDFKGSDFTAAKLRKVLGLNMKADDVIFSNADLKNAGLENSRFHRADFTEADLTEARLYKCDFSGAILKSANLRKADLTDAKLVNADLSKADLREAILVGADCTGANIEGADFTGANLTGAKLAGLNTALAVGLNLAAAASGGKIGPNILELEKAATQSERLETSAVIDLKDQAVEVKLTCYRNCQWISTYTGTPQMGHHGHTRSLSAAMLDLARRWTNGTLRLTSITAKSSKGPLGGKKLQRLAAAAWCEACGVPIQSETEIEEQLQAGKANQAELREQMLQELRGGAEGIKLWNARPGNNPWHSVSADGRRKAGHFRRVDLSNLDLSGANVGGLDFQGAVFDGASLDQAKLIKGDFRKATFRNARLNNAQCGIAKFSGADFTGASLCQTNLRVCTFCSAVFNGADLRGADFGSSDLRGADLSGADLSQAKFERAKYNKETRLPPGFKHIDGMDWKGGGPPPGTIAETQATLTFGTMDFATFMERLPATVDTASLAKALQMLKADRFQLYAEVKDNSLVGVVKSQSDPDLVYSCRLNSDGAFSCCTQNLRPCGGLHGKLCKHLLVLLVGLAKAGQLDQATAEQWAQASRHQRPVLDKDAMSETFLRYKGAEAGEVDWRPTETIPEDYYAL